MKRSADTTRIKAALRRAKIWRDASEHLERIFNETLARFVQGAKDMIIESQMHSPEPPKNETTFAGWTTDEKIAFYARGVVPQRFRT